MTSRIRMTCMSFLALILLVYSCLYYSITAKAPPTRTTPSTREGNEKDGQIDNMRNNSFLQLQAMENEENTIEQDGQIDNMQNNSILQLRAIDNEENTKESVVTIRWMDQNPEMEANETIVTINVTQLSSETEREVNESVETTKVSQKILGSEAKSQEFVNTVKLSEQSQEGVANDGNNLQNETERMSSFNSTSYRSLYTEIKHFNTSIRPDIKSTLKAVHVNATNITIQSQPVLFFNSSSIYSGTEYRNPELVHIGIGLGITTKGDKGAHNLKTFKITSLIFFKTLLHSFCNTASPYYNYHFYVAHDHTDVFFSQKASHVLFRKTFDNFIATHCKPKNVTKVTLTLINCPHSGNPAWAQNDAIVAAHKDKNDFFYRVNDDANMTSKDWTRQYIEALAKFKPPFIGVVGPKHNGGNVRIMTFDFTHRTHIDIFGYHYPRIFKSWYADSWITEVYKPDRSKKVMSVTLHHTIEKGHRYKVDRSLAKKKKINIQKGKDVIASYLQRHKAAKA